MAGTDPYTFLLRVRQPQRILEVVADMYAHRGSYVTGVSVKDLERTRLVLAKHVVPVLP